MVLVRDQRAVGLEEILQWYCLDQQQLVLEEILQWYRLDQRAVGS